MKKIFRILFVLALFTVTFSCDEEYVTLDSGNYHVKFGRSGDTVTESNTLITLPVSLVAAKQSSAVTGDIVISGTAVEGVDYEIVGDKSAINIAAGSFTDEIEIQVLNDFATDGTKTIIIDLGNVTGGVKVGQGGTVGKTYTLTIADDDCPFDISVFAGAYDVEIISEAGFGNPAGSYFATTTLAVGADPNTLVDANFWDFGNPGIITLDPSDPANLTTEILGAQFVYNNATPLPRYAIQGTQPLGSFNTCVGSLVVNMELTREDKTTVANRSVIIYTKQ